MSQMLWASLDVPHALQSPGFELSSSALAPCDIPVTPPPCFVNGVLCGTGLPQQHLGKQTGLEETLRK